jgi:putative hydrolase of the HAD superfamily
MIAMYAQPPRYRAVLFDFFGTLTEGSTRGPAHDEIARSLGCEPEAFSQELNRTFYIRAAGRYGRPLEALRRIARAAGSEPSQEALTRALGDRVEAVSADVRLRPDACDVIDNLRVRGLRVAVITDCWYELPILLPALPVAPLVDAFAYSIQVGRCKPHPAMYQAACTQLGVRPDDCLYVGDGGSQELTGARYVGAEPVRLVAPDLANHLVFSTDQGFVGPCIESLGEVHSLLELDLALALEREPVLV